MLLRNRPPDIDTAPATLSPGLEHLDQGWIAVLRWLSANRVDYVVVGPVAHAIRGDRAARGPVAIVPAPYGRNWDRLTGALVSQGAGLRSDRTGAPAADAAERERGAAVPVKLTADKLARGRRWLLRFSGYDLDVEGMGRAGTGGSDSRPPGYQELLYESHRITLTEGLAVEVAAPEDLEHFSHVRRTGVAPEFRVIRRADAPPQADSDADSEPSDFPADA